MGELLLAILKDEDSAFSKTMQKKISSTLNVVTSKIEKGMGTMKFSKEPVTVMDMSGMDEKTKKDMAKKFETQQKTIYNWMVDVSKAANWENVRGKGNNTISLADFFQTSKSKQSTYKTDFEANQKKIIDAMKTNIPTKADIIEQMTKSGNIEQPAGVPKDAVTEEKPSFGITGLEVDNKMPPPLPKEDSPGLVDGILNKVGGDEAPKSEGFKEDVAKPVIIESLSKEAFDQLVKIGNEIKGDTDQRHRTGTIKGGAAGAGAGGLMGLLGGKMGGKGLIGSMFAKLLPSGAPKALAAAGPMVALIGGIVWMAIDGFRGWMQSGEWGTSKVSGAIGGMMGGMDSGFKGAMKNMGKWALIGAGIGSVVPVVGTLIGGLIGAAIGGILGWIGGENIAKAMDAVGEWFTKQYEKAVQFVTDFLEGDAEEKWALYKKAMMAPYIWLGKTAAKIWEWVDTTLEEKFGEKWTAFKGSFGKFFSWLDEKVVDILYWVDDKLYRVFGERWELFKGAMEKVTNFFKDKIIDPITEFFKGDGLDNVGIALMKFFTEDLPNMVKGALKKAVDLKGAFENSWIGKKAAQAKAAVGDLNRRGRITETRKKIEELENDPNADQRDLSNKKKFLAEMIEENEKVKEKGQPKVADGSANDFIYRPGQPIQKFSGEDVLIGTKEKLVVENKNLDEQMGKLSDIMGGMKDQFGQMLDVNVEMLRTGSKVSQAPTVPLPEISPDISAGRALAYDEALNHKIRGWQIIHGVI